jgi:putative transposase
VPWRQTDPMNERMRFVALHQEGLFSMTELCGRFQISRRVGYKWLQRFVAAGAAGLQDQSRAPHTCPTRTAPAVETALLAVKRAHPHWGPRKVGAYLAAQQPEQAWPAASTVGEVFRRAGLVQTRRPVRPAARQEPVPLVAERPNQVWTVDFKGDFLLGNGVRCYPLTVQDAYSRYLLTCRALASTATAGVRTAFEQLFAAVGLPEVIRSDNGVPFVRPAPLGLSSLSVWWLKLGITHQRIRPGQPQENGRHERMHRTLKAEATRPPAADLAGQQERFAAFQQEYNGVRPHEAVAQQPPATRYAPSAQRLPAALTAPQYPGHYEVRRVNRAGCFHFRGQHIPLTTVLIDEQIGLEEREEGLWSIFYYDRLLARWEEATGRAVG